MSVEIKRSTARMYWEVMVNGVCLERFTRRDQAQKVADQYRMLVSKL